MKILENYLARRILRRNAIAFQEWQEVIDKIPLLKTLSSSEKARLRKLSTLFLYHKTFVGGKNLPITNSKRITVAAQACLQILNLGIESFNGWVEIIIYPGTFKVNRSFTDADGLVHQHNHHLSGESWQRGPLILSWDEVQQDSYFPSPGHNIIIHEFAHKLDMLNGRANGMPPLHPDMPIDSWSQALSRAYELLQDKLDTFQSTVIDPYAGTDPGEFFAVISEYFFTAPQILFQYCPDVYTQLKHYYRQDPLKRGEY